MRQIIVEIYGYNGTSTEIQEAAMLNVEMKDILDKTISEQDGKPLGERVDICVVVSFLTPSRERRKRNRYLKIYAGEDYDAHEVVQALLKNKIMIAKHAICIRAHEAY